MSGRSIRSEKQKEHTEKVFNGYNRDVQAAKELLRKSANGKKPKYNNPYLIAYKVAHYIEQCRQNEKPLTEAGIIVALGVDRGTYKRYLSGENDYIGISGMECAQSEKDIQLQIEHYKTIDNIQPMFLYLTDNDNISLLDSNNAPNIDINDKNTLALSVPLKKARALISLEREERLAISGKVGDIYTMKAREGEDWQETAQRTEHVLKIEGSNAQAALEQLGYTKEK